MFHVLTWKGKKIIWTHWGLVRLVTFGEIWIKIGSGNSLLPMAPSHYLNTLRQRQNGHHFADDIFKCIFLNENTWISLRISLKFVPDVPVNNIPALIQIMAWPRSGDKPLSGTMMVSLLTHICVTRPQWVDLCWLIIKGVLWHLTRTDFTGRENYQSMNFYMSVF